MVLETVEGMVEETAVEMAGMSHTVLAWVAVTADRLSKVVLEEREERVEGMADRLSKVVLEEREEEMVVMGMWNMAALEDMVVGMEVEGMAQDMVVEDWDKGKNR